MEKPRSARGPGMAPIGLGPGIGPEIAEPPDWAIPDEPLIGPGFAIGPRAALSRGSPKGLGSKIESMTKRGESMTK